MENSTEQATPVGVDHPQVVLPPKPEIPARPFAFTEDMERQAMILVATDPSFVRYWHGRLKPAHFSHTYNKLIFKSINEYVTTFNGQLPTIEILIQETNKVLSLDDNRTLFNVHISDLFNSPVTGNREYVRNGLMDHMQAEDYKHFLMDVAACCRDGRYKDITVLLNEVTKRHVITPNEPAYLSEGDSVAKRVQEEKLQRAAMPSPWPTFNANHGGGFQEGTVVAFMGPTGSGKSILLVNGGACLMKCKKVVYHFTFELSRNKTAARYDVCITGVTSEERTKNPTVVDGALNALKSNGMGSLYIIELPTGTCSANKVRATIDDYVARGCPKPDVIILDYLTIMAPNNPEVVDMKKDYAKLKVIAEEVRAMAMERKWTVLTALQSNRGAAGKEKISKEDIADSYAVMHVLDCVLSINQTEAEKAGGKMRLYAAKVRDFNDQYTITCDATYTNLRVSEDTTTTQRYQQAIATKQNDLLVNAGLNTKVNEYLDPSAINMGLETVLGMGMRGGSKPIAIASKEDKALVEEVIGRGTVAVVPTLPAPIPIATSSAPPEPPAIQVVQEN